MAIITSVVFSLLLLFVFSIYCIIQTNKVKRELKRELDFLKVRKNSLQLERDYINYLIKKPDAKMPNYLKQNEYILTYNFFDYKSLKTKFHKEKITEIFEKDINLDKELKQMMGQQICIVSELYRITHPVKHTMERVQLKFCLYLLRGLGVILSYLEKRMEKKQIKKFRPIASKNFNQPVAVLKY